MAEHEDEVVGVYELLDAIEGVIQAADPTKREILAKTIDAYAEDFPDDFYWAVGPQAPALLNSLLQMIDAACRTGSQSKPRAAIRLVHRTPEGASSRPAKPRAWPCRSHASRRLSTVVLR